MKIAPRIIGIFLPLFIVPLLFVTYLAVSTSRKAITEVATQFLQFKATELLRFADSEYQLLQENHLSDSADFVSAAKRAVANYADGLVPSGTELIAAFDQQGNVQFSTSDIKMSPEEKRALLKLASSNTQGWIELRLAGVDRVADMSFFKPFGWTIVVSEETNAFFSSIDRITWESLLTGIAAVAAVIILVILFSRLLTLPLNQVARAMREIVLTGDLSRRVAVRYNDEVGELGDSFNAMTRALDQAYGEIKNYALRAAIAQRREMKIRNIFQKYVPRQVIDQYFRAPESMLVGEDRNLAVLFSDIRGFTEHSENMSSHEIVESLNKYFDGMVDAVMRNEGLVDKYIGDAVMAFFGAPAEDPDSAYHSVLAALDMIDSLEDFNAWQREHGWSAMHCGVGINYGLVTIGNIGSERKMDYTVVGDMVNVASRIEGLTKWYDQRILISESVYRFVGERLPCRFVDRVTVRGRKRGLAIYSVTRKISDAEEQAWSLHDRGTQCYYDRNFREALQYFEAAEKLLPGDPITRVFMRRSSLLLEDPPPPDWTGLIAFEQK